MTPSLLKLDSEDEYRAFFEETYCKCPIITFDGIPVFFHKDQFEHITQESSKRDGCKDVPSEARRERLHWIKFTLESTESTLYKGWDKSTRSYKSSRRVAVRYEDFVVVIQLNEKKNGDLKGKLITCYVADNSIEKIQESPLWNKEDCLNELKKRNGR